MMLTGFGFILLGFLILGSLLVALSLPVLAGALLLQAAGALNPALFVLGTGLMVGAAAVFVVGLLLIAVGMFSFLFAAVRIFLSGLLALLRLIRSFLPSIGDFATFLDVSAAAVDVIAVILKQAVSPVLQTTGQAIGNLPAIPTPVARTAPILDDGDNQTPEGLISDPTRVLSSVLPNPAVVVGVDLNPTSVDSVLNTALGGFVTNPVQGFSDMVGDMGVDADTTGDTLHSVADEMRRFALMLAS